ncbi:Cytoskeleton protein RodZ [Alcanivorax sp. ALC70]|nr:Cytoskeleton protein RodZ [Alcanivorax sp. ALC70]
MSVDEEAMLPGERLRRAREEQGLSQDEVSKHLRLSLSYLRALEEDDYDRLPEPPFIKGYLRNYARFLGLPAEELARRFQQEVDAQHSAEDQRDQEALEDTPGARNGACRCWWCWWWRWWWPWAGGCGPGTARSPAPRRRTAARRRRRAPRRTAAPRSRRCPRTTSRWRPPTIPWSPPRERRRPGRRHRAAQPGRQRAGPGPADVTAAGR